MGKIFNKTNIVEVHKLTLLAFLIGLVALVIVLRLWHIQIHRSAYYKSIALQNVAHVVDEPAPRGMIFDRDDQIILGNKNVFNLVFIPQKSENFEVSLKNISTLLGLQANTIQQRISQGFGQPLYVPIPIKRHLKIQEISLIEARQSQFIGFEVQKVPGRSYNAHQPTHLLGYLSELNQVLLLKKRKDHPELGYSAGELIGKKGLEKIWESTLRGTKGQKVVQVDSKGNKISIATHEKHREAVQGKNLHLTIDLELQKYVNDLFATKNGAVVAMDPRNGAILAIKSSPNYSPSMFQSQISFKKWEKVRSNPFAPLVDKTIRAEYPPGSLYKVVVALAALQEKITDAKREIKCTGYLTLGKEKFHCHNRHGHGLVNLEKALRHSCDIFFYEIGLELGVDRIAKYAHILGLGEKLGIDFGSERAGLIPTKEWKKKNRGQTWKRGETPPVSIGQGYNLLTPLQMTSLYSIIANGGFFWKPFVVRQVSDYFGKIESRFTPQLVRKIDQIDPKYFKLIQKYLIEVVNHPKGSGRLAKVDNFLVAGKTGSAQVVKLNRYYKGEQVSMMWREHAIFAAYAPAQDPLITVLVYSEHDETGGGGGKAAAPIAKKIIERYLLKKGRLTLSGN